MTRERDKRARYELPLTYSEGWTLLRALAAYNATEAAKEDGENFAASWLADRIFRVLGLQGADFRQALALRNNKVRR